MRLDHTLQSPRTRKQGGQFDDALPKFYGGRHKTPLVQLLSLAKIDRAEACTRRSLSNSQKEDNPDREPAQLRVVSRKPVVKRGTRPHSHMGRDYPVAGTKHRTHAGKLRGLGMGDSAKQFAGPGYS